MSDTPYKLAARLFAFSIAILFFLKTGDHSSLKVGGFKQVRGHIISTYVKVRNLRPKFRFAGLILEFICLSNVNVFSSIPNLFSMGICSWLLSVV